MEMLAQELMKVSLEPSSTSEAPGTSGFHPSGCCIQTKPPGSLAVPKVQHDQVATEADARKPSTKRRLTTNMECLAPEPAPKK